MSSTSTIRRRVLPLFAVSLLSIGVSMAHGQAASSLAGNWSSQQLDAEGSPVDIAPPYRTHYRLEVSGTNISVSNVADEDWAPGLVLKGDTNLSYRFQLDGRRVHGSTGGKFSRTIDGIVNEAFTEIQLRITDPKSNCYSSREDAAAGKRAGPCPPVRERLRKF